MACKAECACFAAWGAKSESDEDGRGTLDVFKLKCWILFAGLCTVA